ncbi:MAG: phosphomannomutase/phosphoglucomutase [Kiritimatiellia bacterium]
MSGIFKAYDIRGVYGKDLTDELAYRIGRAYVTFAKCRKIVVARDIRPHSEPLFQNFVKGATEQGADVIDLGHASTPMSYFANAHCGADGGVMITASHNPGEWNGFKLCRANAVPISGASGIMEIQQIVESGAFAALPPQPGKVEALDILPAYKAHVQTFAHLKRPLHLAIDFANGMGIWEAQTLVGTGVTWDGLYETPDGRFPNHEANPLKTETLADLQKLIRENPGKYAFGVAFDGDSDRAGFVDEKGEIVAMDLATALIAQDILATRKGVIFYDLRSSRVVKEVIEAAGGTPMMSRVGHAFIKAQMREHDALFAGELSGHYYFKDNSTAESAAMAALALANMVSNSGKTLSELVAPLRKYYPSGEINSRVSGDPKLVLEKIKSLYGPKGNCFELDGVSVEFGEWWFNVRCSNTEPRVRLNLEATSRAEMERRRDELLSLIRA